MVRMRKKKERQRRQALVRALSMGRLPVSRGSQMRDLEGQLLNYNDPQAAHTATRIFPGVLENKLDSLRCRFPPRSRRLLLFLFLL